MSPLCLPKSCLGRKPIHVPRNAAAEPLAYAARRILISASRPVASTSRRSQPIVTFWRLPDRIPVTA
jgi:hypothetical protein